MAKQPSEPEPVDPAAAKRQEEADRRQGIADARKTAGAPDGMADWIVARGWPVAKAAAAFGEWKAAGHWATPDGSVAFGEPKV